MNNKFISNLKVAKGEGASHEGFHHWLYQRISGAILLVLFFYLVFSMAVTVAGQSYDAATMWLSNPFNAIVMIIAILLAFFHGAIGVRVVIEDYIEQRFAKLFLLYVIYFLAWFLTLFCILAIISIAIR